MARGNVAKQDSSRRSYKPIMTVASREPIGIHKKPTAKFGHTVVRLQIGRDREEFTVHADLLCQDSPYFQETIQPNRRVLEGPDLECAICREPLDQGTNDLVYCETTCGKNFHHHCIEEWRKNQPGAGSLKCPYCRQKWVSESNKIQAYQFPDLDKAAYHIYQEWLYRQHICIEGNKRPLFAAYLLGEIIEDEKFCEADLQAISQRYFKDLQFLGYDIVDYEYDISPPEFALQDFPYLPTIKLTASLQAKPRGSLTFMQSKPTAPILACKSIQRLKIDW